MNQPETDKKSVFSKLFNRQKQKVRAKKNVSNVLRQFADDDLKSIAVVIDEWLKADARDVPSARTKDRIRRYKGE
ncbi:MAG: hypothetical protein ACFHVJ_11370 [Aestuariibacter sp.]